MGSLMVGDYPNKYSIYPLVHIQVKKLHFHYIQNNAQQIPYSVFIIGIIKVVHAIYMYGNLKTTTSDKLFLYFAIPCHFKNT